MTKPRYLAGVDGGGTGTRVRVTDAAGTPIGHGRAGASALMHGSDRAWQAVRDALTDAFAQQGLALPPWQHIALGLGLAGANNPPWAAAFVEADPGCAALCLASDALTTLLGAHGGQPGAVVAMGTGSVGLSLDAHGRRREVGGWGFPAGDEGSGAWLGLRAAAHLQQVLDGRARADALSHAVAQRCGAVPDSLRTWLGQASQGQFASLAPLVLAHAATDALARSWVTQAAVEVVRLADALVPQGDLPLSLCGGLAAPLMPWLPEDFRKRLQPPRGDAADGALILLRQHLSHTES
ncbi:ATPase [Ideonella sp. 4Y11]|uniref:ATPase n=1 Tax=Ideonella aquatica TaxID=2824119 RepID=A0A940YIX3_9BURK|nr:BadF/BadG/BcrA/BcrD ATPase family protein [Ideonella aquatica]MBQ0961098.1 ATPase [Ideonella aquatica]